MSKEAENRDELKIGDRVFKVQKLSGYRLLKILGQADKDAADMYRDLILACVMEPELTKEEVKELSADVFLKLGVELFKLHQGGLKGFRELAEDLAKLGVK